MYSQIQGSLQTLLIELLAKELLGLILIYEQIILAGLKRIKHSQMEFDYCTFSARHKLAHYELHKRLDLWFNSVDSLKRSDSKEWFIHELNWITNMAVLLITNRTISSDSLWLKYIFEFLTRDLVRLIQSILWTNYSSWWTSSVYLLKRSSSTEWVIYKFNITSITVLVNTNRTIDPDSLWIKYGI